MEQQLKTSNESNVGTRTLWQMGFRAEGGNWESMHPEHRENLYKSLRQIMDNCIKPDVEIHINDLTFKCHMMILEWHSKFFLHCNKDKVIRLPSEKVTPNAFKKVYEWMVAERPQLQRERILEVFSASLFLRINSLEEQCWEYFDDNARFGEDTAVLLYMEARSFGMAIVQDIMLMRVRKFFLTLVASEEFLALNIDELVAHLSLHTIGVNSECEIFLSVVRWLDHDWGGRKGHMLKAVSKVRFGLMPPTFLVLLKRRPDCEAIARITSDPQVRCQLRDAINLTSSQLCYQGKAEILNEIMELLQLDPPRPRQWIYDPDCPYHKRVPSLVDTEPLTYKVFLEYLAKLLDIGKDHWRKVEVL